MVSSKQFDVDPEKLTKEIDRLDEISERVRIAGYGLASPLLKMRQGQASREVARVAARKGADHPEVAARKATLERTSEKLARFEEELSRARLDRPSLESETGAGIWGRVADAGKPVADLTVLAQAEGERLAFDCTDDNGSFAMEVPSETPIVLAVRSKDGAELYRDTKPESLAQGQQRFREIDLSRVEPPCEEPEDGEKPDDERFQMVDLVDQSQADAMAILRAQGLSLGKVTFEPSPDKAGRVLSQEPKAGTLVRRDDEVALVVGRSERVPVPNVIGLPLANAEATLKKAELVVGEVREVEVPGSKPGVVSNQQPAAGSRVPRGDKIDLEVGKREDMPDFVGRDVREAVTEAKRLEIETSLTQQTSPEPADRVIGQDPAAGTRVRVPAEVKLTVSTGPQDDDRTVVMPDFIERPIGEVVQAAKRLGLELIQTQIRVDGPRGIVVAQEPAPSTEVRLPTTVKVEVNVGLRDREDSSEFMEKLAKIAARDERLSALNLNEDSLRKILTRLNITNKARAEEVVALNNAQLRQAAGLGTLSQARTFRSILRAAVSRVD